MQKRVVGNINELNEAARKTASEKSAFAAGADRSGCKANKTSFGRFKKFAAIVMLLIVSVFCAIGSADWIISQQEQLPGGSGSTFVYDKKTLQNYIALKGSDETEAAAKVAEAEEYASLQTETDSDDSAVADKFTVKKAAVAKKTAASTYANGLESAIYGKSAIYNGKPIVAIKKTAGIDNAVADLPSSVLNGSLLTSYKPLTDGSVTEADLTEAYFAEGATSGLPQNAGTYAILVKIKGLEAYGYAVKIFTILPCPVTVDWSGIDFANGFTYDGAAHPVTVAAKIASSDNGNIEGSEVNADLSVSIAKDGVSVSEVKTAGDYTLTAASGNDNYVIYDTEATRTTSFKVKQAPLAVTVNDKTITYGDAVPGFTLSYKGFVGGETASVLGGTATFTHGYKQFFDAKTYTVTASGLTSENYEITYNKGTLTVIKYGLELSWSNLAFVYGKTAYVPTAAITNPLPSGAADPGLNVSVTTGEAINVGSYTAKASVTDGNYSIASGETKTFTINKRKATVTVNLSKTEIAFGSEAPTATINYSGVLDGDTLGTPTFDYGGYKKGSDVGTYTVTVTTGLANDNYDIKPTSANFTVTPYGLNIEWSDTPFTYNKAVQKPVATISNPIEGLTEPAVTVTTYSETGVAADSINAGSYTAKASVADTNYYIASGETKTFTINKKSVTIIVGKSVTYGDTATFSENDLTITGLIGNDTLGGNPTFASEYTAGSPVTEEGYAITVTFSETALNPNYSLDSLVITGTLTVNKKALTIKVKDCSVNYGGDPDFELEYTGFVNGETSAVLSGKPGFGCDYEKGTSPAGKTYTVTVISGLYSKNYKITYLSGTLTVNKKSVTITIENKTIIYGDEAPTSYSYKIKDTLTGENISTDEFTAINSKIEFACTYAKGYPAGDYKITATCNNDNYTLTVPSGKLTVNKANLTLVANDNDIGITYGEAPSANGYYYKGFLLNDNEQSANITGTVKYSFDYNQYDNIYDADGNKKSYHITPSVENFSSTNYACSDIEKGTLTVNKLPVKATVEKTYNDSSKDTNGNYAGLHFNKDLFKDSFAPVNANITLPDEYKLKIYNDINDSSTAVAKNFTGTQDTSKAENGFFEYSFGDYIKAGSTYAITGLTLKNTSNYSLSGTVYLKYKTAKIGNSYYTIEDAINSSESGDIVLASNSTDKKTYVITSFSKIGYYGGNSFTCGKNIIVPHADGKTSSETAPKDNKPSSTTKNVGSVLIVPEGISLTMNSATLDILAIVAMDGLVTCTTYNRGVVMNHGTIKVTGTINNGDTPNIKAYGYLKGTGNVIVTDGATAEDLFHIFDFKGGGNTYGIKKGTENYLPINAYSLHNISCSIKVYAGCIYNALYEIYMGGSWFTGRIPVVGKSDASSALFKLSEGYIEKTAIPADNSTSKDLDTITGSNQLKGQKEDVKIYGTVVDGSITISAELGGILSVDMTTGTSNPLPIPYMDIRVCRGGNLTLANSSYKFMPGSALLVDDGGYLTVGSNAKLVFYSVEDCAELEKPVTYKASKDAAASDYPYNYMTKYCVDKSDAYFEINSNNTSLGGYLSGKITTKNQDIKINIKNASADITVLNTMTVDAKTLMLVVKYAEVTTRTASSARPMTATGNIMTSRNNYGESEFTAGTYYSTNVGTSANPVYAWFKDTATITYVPNGGTLNGSTDNYSDTVSLPAGGYTQMPSPSKSYYTFDGWYFDSDLTEKATAVFTDCTLYAKWNPIKYTVIYNFDKAEYGTLPNESLLGNEIKILSNPPMEQVTINGDIYKFIGWYLKSNFIGESVSSVNAKNANDSKIINVYAYYTKADDTYRIDFNTNPENITFANNKTVITLESRDAQKGIVTNIESLVSLLDIYNYNSDSDFDYYFSGWYLSTDDTETILNELPDTITTNIILYAKWEKKNILTINFASNDLKLQNNKNLDELVKYYHNESINLNDIYSTASIDKKIDNIYPPHNGNVKEYLLSSWIEDNNTLSSEIIDMTKDRTVTAYHKRCYYIVVQLQNENIKGVTSGTGIYYVSSSENNYSLSITCTTTTNERYTPIYSAENASIDTNGVLSFTNSNSAQDIVISVSTKHWYTVISSYSDFKITKESGEQDGNWFTEGSKIKISISGKILAWESNKKASINKNGKQVATLEQAFGKTKEYEISNLDGYYTITKMA